jgi:hypothetical protein
VEVGAIDGLGELFSEQSVRNKLLIGFVS